MARQWRWWVAAAFVLASPVLAQQTEAPDVLALSFHPDGKRLFAVGEDDKLHVFDTQSGKETAAREAHKDGAWALALARTGQFLVTGGRDKRVILWDAKTLKQLHAYAGSAQEVMAVALSPDGKTVVAGGADGVITTWDAATGQKTRFWRAHEFKVLSLKFSPDGATLASAGTSAVDAVNLFRGVMHADRVRLWDPATGKEIRALITHGQAVAFAPDGRSVATAGYYAAAVQRPNGIAKAIVQAETRAAVVPLHKESDAASMNGAGNGMALSADGRLLALGNGSHRNIGGGVRFGVDSWAAGITIWETASGKQLLEIPMADSCGLAFSPDGKRLAVGVMHQGVRFHDLAPEGWPKKNTVPFINSLNLAGAWVDLAGEDASLAYRQIWTLGAGGDAVVDFLKAKLSPVPAPDDKVAGLVAKLDSNKYAEREAAFGNLKKRGGAVEGELRKAAAIEKASPEFRQRVAKLLENLQKRPASPDELQQVRALQVLERIATPAAKSLLTQIAEGAPGAWLTEQAQLAVRRLEQR